MTAPPRRALTWLFAAAAVMAVTGACTDADRPSRSPGAPVTREVVLDHGTADVVDLRPVTVQAAAGDRVVMRSANPGLGGDDESPVHHLFTSASADAQPPLFTTSGGGLIPNPGAWGLCRGGAPEAAAVGCPVPPIDGPSAYDGAAYFSLGALLPGEQRELPLADDLAPGTYRFICVIHPQLYVDVQVVPDPEPATEQDPLDPESAIEAARQQAPSAGETAVVLLGPQTEDPAAEVLESLPQVVRIPVGGSVVWRVQDRSPHTVELGVQEAPHLADTAPADTVPIVPRDRRWDGSGQVRSGILSTDPSAAGTEFSLTFTRAGQYRAYDRFHSGISTLIRVG